MQHKDFLHDITDRITIRISLILKPHFGRSVDKQEFQLISLWRALCNVDLDNLIEFHWATQNEIEQILLIYGLGQALIITFETFWATSVSVNDARWRIQKFQIMTRYSEFLYEFCFRKWRWVHLLNTYKKSKCRYQK